MRQKWISHFAVLLFGKNSFPFLTRTRCVLCCVACCHLFGMSSFKTLQTIKSHKFTFWEMNSDFILFYFFVSMKFLLANYPPVPFRVKCLEANFKFQARATPVHFWFRPFPMTYCTYLFVDSCLIFTKENFDQSLSVKRLVI